MVEAMPTRHDVPCRFIEARSPRDSLRKTRHRSRRLAVARNTGPRIGHWASASRRINPRVMLSLSRAWATSHGLRSTCGPSCLEHLAPLQT